MILRRPFVAPFIFALPMAALASAAEPTGPQVKVELIAEHATLAPGQSTTLAIAFEIESGWHIYWQNPGEGGLGTTFEWQLPDGFQVGPMLFPPPRRYVDVADAATFILEGRPVILARLSAPASAQAGETAAIGVTVDWLACKESCVPGHKELSIRLPVAAGEMKTQDANTATFRMARNARPAPAGKAQYLNTLSAVASVDKVRPGSRFEVAVILEVQPGHHVNSAAPLSKLLIPTDLFHERTEGLMIGRPSFPPGTVEEQVPPAGLSLADKLRTPAEKLSIYRGKTVIRLPVEADGELAGQTVRIGGIVTYQACSDVTKQCFPPAAAEWSLTLPVAKPGEAVASVALPGPNPSASKPARSTPDLAPPPVAVGPAPAVPAEAQPPGFGSRTYAALISLGTIGYVILAFAGGLLMNLMPCVLPVISIKILSFVQQAKESRLRVLTLGLAFAGGIQLSFVVLGLLILGLLKGVGLELQWGGFFQSPLLVIGFAAVVTGLALSLFGVFTLSPPQFFLSVGGQIRQEGHLNAFCMGLLATILGTACTAPLVSGAVAWAVTQPAGVGMSIFIFLGLGMALPYVVLAAKPAWIKFVPRPGPWMETFEQVMGFLLLGTVVFLLNTLAHQLGGEGLVWTIVFLLFVAAAAWCYGRVGFGAGVGRQAAYYGSAVLLLVGGWWLCFQSVNTIPDLIARQQALLKGTMAEIRTDWPDPDKIPWVPYTRQRTLNLVTAGKTVFIDYTATWCVNCKTNEIAAIDTAAVRAAMRRMSVVPIRADYTLKDPEIKADLDRFGSGAVPMTLIIPANRPEEPIVLGVLLSQSEVLEGLKRAGPSAGAAVSVAGTGG